MIDSLLDWLAVLLRWAHVFAAFLWVGQTYLFNFMEKSLERDDETPENVRGRLWMVHGGGFYFVEKQKRLQGHPRTLHWFKYESAFTWLSGAVLIWLTYYRGGVLVEPGQSYGRGVAAGLCTIVGGWLVYDLLVRSPLGKREGLVALIGWGTFVGAAYGLRAFLSPRAVFIHIGAMIGTIMAANVWMRILPSQKKMLAAIEEGAPIAGNISATGPLRSKQNSYLAIPLVFLMISNHAPTIVGSPRAHLWLGALILCGWGVARLFRGPTHAGQGAPAQAREGGPAHAAVALGLLGAALTVGIRANERAQAAEVARAPKGDQEAPGVKAPKGHALIAGVVKLQGAAPPPEPWGGAANNDCRGLHEPKFQPVSATDGKLAGAFVYVKDGLPAGSYDPPSEPVSLDQRGCEFSPRVFGVMAGQPIRLGNQDAFLHNVSSPEFNQAFTRGAARSVELDNPGVMVTIKCDVHPWMRAYAGVLDHPYFAVTGEDGAFRIGDLPDGQYTVAAWHEKLGTTSQKVAASEAAPGRIELTLASK